MNKLLFVFTLSILIVSCGGESPENDTAETSETDTISIDTLAMDSLQIQVDPNRPVIDVDALFAKAEGDYELPFSLDSAFISQFSQEESDPSNLTGEEASYLGFDLLDDGATEMSHYQIRRFEDFDSMRTNDVLEDYLRSLDIGQARFCNGNVAGKVKVSEQTSILLWYTTYATYEACPYGSGIYVWGTVFTNGIATTTSLMGEMSGGGDPPSWGDTRVYSEITAEQIVTTSVDRWGEEDYETGEEYTEVTSTTFIIQLEPTGLTLLETKEDE